MNDDHIEVELCSGFPRATAVTLAELKEKRITNGVSGRRSPLSCHILRSSFQASKHGETKNGKDDRNRG